jgi:hypothetical protein
VLCSRRPCGDAALKVALWCDQPTVSKGGRADGNYIMPHQLVFAHVESDLKDPITAGIVQELEYPGYSIELPHLPSRMCQSFRGFFTLQQTPPYVGGGLRAAILISDLHEPTGWRLVQRRELRLRCEPNFTPDAGSDSDQPIKLLLVCSTAICRAKFVAWFDVARSFGMRAEVFPLTRCTCICVSINHINLPTCCPLDLCSPPILAAFSCRWSS